MQSEQNVTENHATPLDFSVFDLLLGFGIVNWHEYFALTEAGWLSLEKEVLEWGRLMRPHFATGTTFLIGDNTMIPCNAQLFEGEAA